MPVARVLANPAASAPPLFAPSKLPHGLLVLKCVWPLARLHTAGLSLSYPHTLDASDDSRALVLQQIRALERTVKWRLSAGSAVASVNFPIDNAAKLMAANRRPAPVAGNARRGLIKPP
ncbi:uncharacterized protein VTP21DRAFT_909 [Calcarisporiella thermophila]|uniref:uncharacterized protein n=1 Tax=Calcarisporiella thermophila TaxID=911321 RepID=UPI003744096D